MQMNRASGGPPSARRSAKKPVSPLRLPAECSEPRTPATWLNLNSEMKPRMNTNRHEFRISYEDLNGHSAGESQGLKARPMAAPCGHAEGSGLGQSSRSSSWRPNPCTACPPRRPQPAAHDDMEAVSAPASPDGTCRRPASWKHGAIPHCNRHRNLYDPKRRPKPTPTSHWLRFLPRTPGAVVPHAGNCEGGAG